MWLQRIMRSIALTLFALLCARAGSAHSVSLSELQRLSPKLPSDQQLNCGQLREAIGQLDRNVVLIEDEIEAGRAAMERFTDVRLDGGIPLTDARAVDVEAPTEIRIGIRKLVEIQRLASKRSDWLRELIDGKACVADVIITDLN